MTEKKAKALFVWCEPSFMDALRKRAHDEKITLSKLVRRWLKESLEQKPLELADAPFTNAGDSGLNLRGGVSPKET